MTEEILERKKAWIADRAETLMARVYEEVIDDIEYDQFILTYLLKKAGPGWIHVAPDYLTIFFRNEDEWYTEISWDRFREEIPTHHVKEMKAIISELEKTIEKLNSSIAEEERRHADWVAAHED